MVFFQNLESEIKILNCLLAGRVGGVKERGENRKGEGRREKGEGRREKGEGRREKGRPVQCPKTKAH